MPMPEPGLGGMPLPHESIPSHEPVPLPPPRPTDRDEPMPAIAGGQAVPAGRKQGDRANFIKGELAGGAAVHPLTQRNFVGVAVGTSAIPNGPGTALNTFFLTVEPQVDLRLEKAKLSPIMGFGVPLQFGLVDTRGAFEECVPVARNAREMTGTEDAVKLATADCVTKQKDKTTQNLGKLRKQDWDEPSDYAKVIRYFRLGHEESPFYLNISRLYGQSLGHGTVVRRYNANLSYNTTRVGATFDAYHRFLGFESMINDVINPDVFGVLGFVRPLEPFFGNVVPLRSLSFGFSAVGGRSLPSRIAYERGLFSPAFDKPIPRIDSDFNIEAASSESVSIFGGNAEAKLIRTRYADLKLYFDFEKMSGDAFGKGMTFGSLWRFSFGDENPWGALRIRAEFQRFDSNYLPSFFDSFHDIHKTQYMPAGFRSEGLTYYPTKLGFLRASKGGPTRNGGTFEATWSFLGYLTVGGAVKASSGASWAGPAFSDYPKCAWQGSGSSETLDCTSVAKVNVPDPGYTSVLLHVEIPFKEFLQAFATYEAFSSPTDGGLGLLKLDGENETFFTGARLQLLPVFFLQGEARRYYFLQRLSNVDLKELTVKQDGNYHAEWTFSFSVAAGLEF